MSPRITLAVTGRVLTQLRRDHRTMAMLLLLPCLLMSLLWWMFDGSVLPVFDRTRAGPAGHLPVIVMFLVTSVTTLRERSSGTLERLLSMPMGRLDFLVGYAVAFGAVAAVQSVLAVAVSVGLLGLDVRARCGCSPWSPWSTRCSAPRWACWSRRSRRPSSRPSSSCRWW